MERRRRNAVSSGGDRSGQHRRLHRNDGSEVRRHHPEAERTAGTGQSGRRRDHLDGGHGLQSRSHHPGHQIERPDHPVPDRSGRDLEKGHSPRPGLPPLDQRSVCGRDQQTGRNRIMTRGTFGVTAALKISEKTAYELGLLLSVGDGPTELRIGPKDPLARLAIKDMVAGLAEMLEINRFNEVGGLPTSWPWSKILEIEVRPELTVEVTSEPSAALVLELYEGGRKDPGVKLPGDGVPSWLTIKPNFTVKNLVVSYDKKRGLDVRASVEFEDQQTGQRKVALLDGKP